MTKECASCSYCLPDFAGHKGELVKAFEFAKCLHPAARSTDSRAMLHASLFAAETHRFCLTMRTAASLCGENARYFVWANQNEDAAPSDADQAADDIVSMFHKHQAS